MRDKNDTVTAVEIAGDWLKEITCMFLECLGQLSTHHEKQCLAYLVIRTIIQTRYDIKMRCQKARVQNCGTRRGGLRLYVNGFPLSARFRDGRTRNTIFDSGGMCARIRTRGELPSV